MLNMCTSIRPKHPTRPMWPSGLEIRTYGVGCDFYPQCGSSTFCHRFMEKRKYNQIIQKKIVYLCIKSGTWIGTMWSRVTGHYVIRQSIPLRYLLLMVVLKLVVAWKFAWFGSGWTYTPLYRRANQGHKENDGHLTTPERSALSMGPGSKRDGDVLPAVSSCKQSFKTITGQLLSK